MNIKGMEFIGKVDAEWSDTKLTWDGFKYGVSVKAHFNGVSDVKKRWKVEVKLRTLWAMDGDFIVVGF